LSHGDGAHLSIMGVVTLLCGLCGTTQELRTPILVARMRQERRFRDRHLQCAGAKRVETDDDRSVA
jgi:hypothetical protein